MSATRLPTDLPTRPLADAVTQGRGVTLSLNNYSAANPLYIAHRGGSLRYPEETAEGYAAAFSAGQRLLEMDVQKLSDGALAVMHDTTVDRTTTGTGNVSSFSTAGWQALGIDAGAWLGGGFGSALVPPLFSELVAAYKGRAILLPEVKAGAGTESDMVTALGDIARHQVLFQSFTLSTLAAPIAAGFPALYLTTTSTDIAAAQAAGVAWVGISSAAADAVFTAWVAAGFKVLGYTINRRLDRDRLAALGVMGYYSDDPEYLASASPRATADNFAAQTWQAGMFGSNDQITEEYRGRFAAPDYWGFSSATPSNYRGVLQGWACPIKGNANADSFTLDVKITFDGAADATRWASVWIASDDRQYINSGLTTENGYHLLMRKNGSVQIYKVVAGGITTLHDVAGTTIADGAEVPYRITVTPSAITLSRLDGGGGVVTQATTTDTTFRGGYFHLGRNGLACKFRDISIT